MSAPARESYESPVDIRTLLQVHHLLAGGGLQYLIYGGWGIDIIAGRQSRPHGDLDLFCWGRDYHRLRSLLTHHGVSGYELPGRHLAVKSPFRADIVFFDDPSGRWVVGTTSTFMVRLPRRGLAYWSHGLLAGHRLPVGCRELVVRLCGHSPNSRPGDGALVKAIAARCDRRLLAEIVRTPVRYDGDGVWRPFGRARPASA